MDIIFTNTSGVLSLEQPKPASQFVPDWYKNTESYIGGEKELQEIVKVNSRVQTKFFNKYKTMFRSPKEYK